ncbi:MAG: NAD(P)/FAD-dependent oxidoreductase [Candidatus Electrothrix sp. AR5]|nr:NAD(P)/FAD-dependent oxidoreductase [Candidatus Electrothrix sp. AR5]
MTIMTQKEKQYDVIIIGSGLGGLTAGAKLAQDGYKVLLLEQHSIPGGCATTFKRKGYTMDVGLHAMDGLDEKDRKKKIFEELGVVDNIDFIRLPEFYRIKNQRIDVVVPSSTKEAVAALSEIFPEEKKGIKKFFQTLHAIQDESNRVPMTRWKATLLLPFFPFFFPNIFFNTFTTVGQFLDKIITNNDLKIILAGNILYYHDDPHSMSLVYFGIAQASYFNGGSHYIKGGSQKLSDYLSRIITKNKGKVLLNRLATEIICEKGEAVGVKYIHTRNKYTQKKVISCKTAYGKKIIANTAIPNVVSLLKGKNSLRLEKKIDQLRKPCSLISVYICFKSEIKSLQNEHYSTFLLNDQIRNLRDMQKNHSGPFSRRNFFFTDYSQIDSGLTEKGKSVGTVSTADYFSDWEGLNEQEYKKKKDEIAHVIFKKLEELIPGIQNEIEYYEVGTPKTIQRYTLNPDGIVYGFAQLPQQAGIFRLPNKSPVKNLYFASAWSIPGGGFTGAILSGWLCAHEVTRSLKTFLSLLHKKTYRKS